MESFSVRTTLNQRDWLAYLAAAGARMATARAGAPWLTRIAMPALWLVLGAVFVVMLCLDPPLLRPEGLLLLAVTFVGVGWLQRAIQKRGITPLENGAFIGPVEFDFESAGFHWRRRNATAVSQWSLIKEVSETPDHVFLWIDAYTAYVVPARDLPAGLTPTTAAARLREFVAAASAGPREPVAVGNPTEALDTDAGSQTGPQSAAAPVLPTVAQELLALLRLHVWRVVDATRLYGRDTSIILLGVFSFLLWAGLDRLNYEGDVELFWYTISETGVLVLAVLLVGWLLSRLSRPRIELRRALLLVLGFLPVVVAGIWIAMRLPNAGAIVCGVLLMGAADVYLSTGMRSVTGRRQQFAVTSMLIVTAALFYLSIRIYFSPGIWYEPEPDAEQSAATQQQNEQLVFEQSARIDADVASLAPREPGKANAFFVGFAGFGDQKVFAEEIGLAAKRMGERYGTAQRSVLLVNDRRDSEKYPIATVPALRHALNALSQHMDREEDVLFLSLSSHGSEDGAVSVSSELGYWRDLEVDDLADMLRESGIRWRVIVVSACYAGSFVEPLRDENTIILTAAAADRTSFGCADDNDLTYFGEAFYRDALPKAPTLRAAFDDARAAILERETQEGITHSNPQAHFGAAIEKKLAQMEAARAN